MNEIQNPESNDIESVNPNNIEKITNRGSGFRYGCPHCEKNPQHFKCQKLMIDHIKKNHSLKKESDEHKHPSFNMSYDEFTGRVN